VAIFQFFFKTPLIKNKLFQEEAILIETNDLKRNEHYKITTKEIEEGDSFLQFNMTLV
jgi:hypothetical protein